MIINLLKLSSEHAASISTNVFIELVAIYQVSENQLKYEDFLYLIFNFNYLNLIYRCTTIYNTIVVHLS